MQKIIILHESDTKNKLPKSNVEYFEILIKLRRKALGIKKEKYGMEVYNAEKDFLNCAEYILKELHDCKETIFNILKII